ncbi:UNVERIFIED_CONTAM: hypothetical protein Slati_4296900 [Sesamum latifolium]|uniref:Uncharacterized protein n=1 Tax=Sesamum latifolium TaxID=2727402 RepID=A0AAW2TCI5_9LAMI
MEETSRREMQGVEDMPRQRDQLIQLTRQELRRLIEESGQSVLVAYERTKSQVFCLSLLHRIPTGERAATPIAKGTAKRQLFKEREVEVESKGRANREESVKGRAPEFSEVRSSGKERTSREPAISRAEVDNVGKKIEQLGKQI